MSTLVKLVGINIKQLRKSINMTQDELAEKCELQTSYLAGVERGDRNITLQTLEKIISGLEIEPANVFNFESVDLEKNYLEKKEKIKLLLNLIDNKSENEVNMILNIVKEIFTTYK